MNDAFEAFNKHVDAAFSFASGERCGAEADTGSPGPSRGRIARQAVRGSTSSESARTMLNNDDSSDNLEALVVGCVNSGKSSLCNCILGYDASAVDVYNNTWTINRYSASKNTRGITKIWTSVKNDSYASLSCSSPLSRTSEGFVYTLPTSIARELIDLESLRYKQNRSSFYSSIVEIEHESDPTLNLCPAISLVDTPRLDQQGLDLAHANYFSRRFRRADIILWTVRGTELESGPLIEAMKRHNFKQKPAILVVTCMDRPELRSEKNRLRKQRTAERLYGALVSDIILFSNRTASLSLKLEDLQSLNSADNDLLHSYQPITEAALRDISGLGHLKRILEDALTGKRAKIRRITEYNEARARAAKIRLQGSLLKEREQRNHALCAEFIHAIKTETSRLCNEIDDSMSTLRKSSLAHLHALMPTITSSNYRSYANVLQLDILIDKDEQVELTLTHRISTSFSELITQFQSRGSQSNDSGNGFALSYELRSLLNIELAFSQRKPTQVNVDVDSRLNVFDGTTRVARYANLAFLFEKNDARIRAILKEQITQQMLAHLIEVRARLTARCARIQACLRTLITRTYSTEYTPVSSGRAKVDGSVVPPAYVPPVFISGAVKIMKSYRWDNRRSDA